MTKCFSLTGVCADVYMGEFDNMDYQEAARIESDIAKADNQSEEIQKENRRARAAHKPKYSIDGAMP